MPNRFRPALSLRKQLRPYLVVSKKNGRKVESRVSVLGEKIRGPQQSIEMAWKTDQVKMISLKYMILEQLHLQICQPLDVDWAISAVNDADLVMIAKRGTTPEGFLSVVKENDKNGIWKLNVICSRGMGIGHMLMTRLELLAKQMGVKQIRLDAADHAIDFYRNLGYGNSINKCAEKPKVSQLYNELVKQYGKNPLKNNQAAYMDFMDLLDDLGLSFIDNSDNSDNSENSDEIPQSLYPMVKCF